MLVRVEESTARGRDLVATAPLRAGHTVMTCAPLALVPSDAFLLTVCCGCLQHCPLERKCEACGAVLLCEACAAPGHRHAALHADECASLRQLRDDPAVRQRSRNGADTSSLRLLLRLIYAARREREGTLPPLLLADEADEVIEDDMEAMASLEDHSDSFPSDLLDSVSDAVARAKFLLAADARASSAEYEGYLARMFTNSFALQAYRDSHARTRQPKAEVGSGVFCSIALINHSCRPNSEVQLTEAGFLRVVTTRPLAEGEPITLSYLPLPIPRTIGPPRGVTMRQVQQEEEEPYGVEGRHRDLKAAFFFDCDCGCQYQLRRPPHIDIDIDMHSKFDVNVSV